MRTLVFFVVIIAIAGPLLFFTQCKSESQCMVPEGHWTNREGQEMIFLTGNKALWLTEFGSQNDTDYFDYRLDCNTEVPVLDFNGFQSGPFTGKTLFGIFEWTSDTSFRLRYEAGTQPDARPKAFDNEQTMRFFRLAK